jgi:hypothetical protein
MLFSTRENADIVTGLHSRPEARMKTIGKTMTFLALTALAATGSGSVAATPSRADNPVMHEVKYVITAASPIYADIYYLDQDPTKFSDYSHNPYQYTPNVQADIAPGHPWVSPPVMIANPDQYAMVSVSTGSEPGTPNFHCALIVDGVVKASNDGAKGALCSLRLW